MSDATETKSYGDGQPRWARVLRSLYDADYLDWRTWHDLLTKWGFQDVEIAETIEWMDTRGMPEPKTAKTLRAAIFARRDMARQGATGFIRTDCARCGGNGVFIFWPETDFGSARFLQAQDQHEEILRATMIDYRATIICPCEVGKGILSKAHFYAKLMPPDKVSALIQASEDAAKQADYVAQQLAQWSARYPRGSRRERVTLQDIGFEMKGVV